MIYFQFTCSPGTVYDPEIKVCNHPKNTKRSECGGLSSVPDDGYENEIDQVQRETNLLISSVLPWTTGIKHESSTKMIPNILYSSSTVNPWEPLQISTNRSLLRQANLKKREQNVDKICSTDGFVGDIENCRTFYRCISNLRGGFIKYEYSCDEGTIWDDDLKTCNFPGSVKRSRCSNNNMSNAISRSSIAYNTREGNEKSSTQLQLQISYGSKVNQTQTQISNGSVKQNQTQINYAQKTNNNEQSLQNQTQISYGSAVSQSQVQINYANKNMQTQTQIDHSNQSSQSQIQINNVDSTAKTTQSPTTANQTPQVTHTNDDICKSSGFVGDPSDCKKFYRCVDNGKGSYTRYQFSCGEGTLWDQELEACNHAWAVKNCGTNSPTESTTINTSTNTAATQTKSTTQSSSTSFSTISATQTSQTTNQIIYTTTTLPSKSDENICKSEGFFGDNDDCKKFYRCVNNGKGSFAKYEFTCGEGTVWDESIEACNHKWAVKSCGKNSSDINKEEITTTIDVITTQSTSFTTTENVLSDEYNNENATTQSNINSHSTTINPIEGDNSDCKESGFMGDKKDCKKFFRCVDNGREGYTKYEFTCGEGTVWDQNIEACNHIWAVKDCKTSQTDVTQSSSTTSTTAGSNQNNQLITSTAATATISNVNANNECPSEGFYGDKQDCKKFYRCVSDGKEGLTKYEFTCGYGTVWDQNTQGCNHGSDKDCKTTANTATQITQSDDYINTTTGTAGSSSYSTESIGSNSSEKPTGSNNCKSEGFFGDRDDCRKFYRCVDNGSSGFTKYEFSCGDGTAWDQEIQTCNHALNGECKNTSESTTDRPQTTVYPENTSTITESLISNSSSTSKPISKTECISEGFYGNPNDCKLFYRCVDNGNGGYTKYEFSCGDGTIWDQEIQGCNHPSNKLNCSISSNSTTEATISSSESTNKPLTTTEDNRPTKNPDESGTSSYICISEGFFANTADCRKFIRCVDNGQGSYTKYDFSCGQGTIWVQEIQACDHDDGTCKSQSTTQTSLVSSTTTTTERQQDITSSSSSLLSTTQSQTTEKQEDEYPTDNNNEETCTSEGFHPNKNDCRKFYRCVDNGNGGFTKYDFTCGEGTAWDDNIKTCNHIAEVETCQENENTQIEDSNNAPESTTESSSTTSDSKPSKDQCKEEGYFGDANDCKMFYRCVDNGKGGFTKYDFKCADGTIWDQDILNCNHPQDVAKSSCNQEQQNAGTSTSSSNQDTSNSSSSKPSTQKVNCTKAGFYPNPDDCKKFYRCVDWDNNGKRFSVFHFECGEGTVWDPELDTCNYEDSVYPPRNCSGSQSQAENVQETTTEEQPTSTTEQSTTESSTINDLTTTTQESTTTTTTTTTTQKSTTSEETTEETTTEKSSTTTPIPTTQEQTTEQQITTEQQTTTESQTTQESITKQQTTQESTTEEQTTQKLTTEQPTTQESSTDEQTTQDSNTEAQTTQEATTQQSTTQDDQNNETTQTTEQSTTTEQSESGSTTDSASETTTQQSSEKECPETEDDQYLYVCPTSFRRHPKYCNLFYQCDEDEDTHEVKLATFKCPNNTIYDETQTKCVDESKADKKCDGQIAMKRNQKRSIEGYKDPVSK